MAKFAQPLLVIAGTIIGAEFGYPLLGAALGGLAGQLLFPTKLPTQIGPRLSDLAATVSNVGAPIPRGWGTFPATGCIIVQTDLIETIDTETVGGSGTQEQTTETPQYHQTFAIGINDGPIGGIRVIWANGKAIYDRRPQGTTESGGPDESDTVYQARQAASDQVEAGFTIYLGTEDQLPDPSLEAFFGVGNISAFRGLAYIVFHDWLNKPEDGNRMPSQWKFEVFGTGDRTDDSPYTYGAPQIDPWVSGDYPILPEHAANYQFSILARINGAAQFNGGFDTFEEACAQLDDYIATENFDPPAVPTLNLDFCPNAPPFREIMGSQWKVQGYNAPSGTVVYLNNTVGGEDMAADHQDWNFAYVAVNCFTRAVATGGFIRIDLSTESQGTILEGLDSLTIYFIDNGLDHFFYVKSDDEADLAPYVAMGFPPAAQSGDHWETTQRCRYIRITRRILPPDDPCLDRPDVPGASDYCVTAQGAISVRGPWELIEAAGEAVGLGVLHESQGVGGAADTSTTNVRGGPVLLTTDPDNTEQFWTDHYNLGVLQGTIGSGLVYGTDYPSFQDPYYRRPAVATASITVGDVALSDIVKDLCQEAGLDPVTQVDVTAIEGLRVLGYVRTSVMAARGALIPLAQAYFFDGIESELKITWRPRGADTVLELGDEDLGAAVIADNDTGPPTDPRYTLQDTDDMSLPAQIRVHYMSQARDYESGEQDSPFRADTAAVQISDVELPIVLTDDHAMQIAQSLWAQAWVERTSYSAVVDGALQAIEAGDPVAVPVPDDANFERTVRMRITQITDSFPATRQLQLIADDAAAYVSHAISNRTVPIPRPVLTVVLPADAYFLDLPGLRDQDNDAGFYFAPYGAVPSEFSGAGLYRSTDGGGNFGKVSQAGPPSVTVGNVAAALPAGPTDIFDYENTLHVKLLDNAAALFSSNEADVLSGANAAAIGADGRWEIVQFTTATQVSASAGANVWALTGLLRGRRGTEWAVGSSQPGDQFAMLNGLVRVPLDSSQIGATSLYKVVGTGGVIDGAPSVSFTGRGVALKPFSVVNIQGERDAPSSDDWTISWTRRNRIGQTLQGGALPLSEASEQYQIDILSGSTVKRTITASAPQAVYTAAQQTTDFGSAQSSLTVAIYQISHAIGHGYGATATLT